jgi:protein O-mannosyl-transferase
MKLGSQSHPVLLAGLVLGLGTLALYWPVLHCGFINYDDNRYVTANPRVLAGLTPESLRWAFQAGYGSNWHPLTWLSHMLDCQLFGRHAGAHHLVSVGFHIVNTLLLFGVLRQMTGAIWRSAFVAALFAWHPAHVESVAWVAERKDVLSTFFFLLTLWAYAKYVEQSKGPGRFGDKVMDKVMDKVGPDQPLVSGLWSVVCGPHSVVRSPWSLYSLALLCFLLGLMSKPMLVTLPLVLLLMDYWPLRRFEVPATAQKVSVFRRLFWEKLPFFALSIVSSMITLLAQKRGGSVIPLEVLSFDSRCFNALVSYLRYVGKLIWPRNLSVIYPYVYEWPLWFVALAAVVLLTVTFLALRLRRQAPYLAVGWFWYLGTLVPVIGFVQVGEQAMADRYMYIPSIGFFLMLAWAIPELVAKWPGWRFAIAFTGALLLATCSVVTHAQLRYWRDSRTLFEHAIAITQNNAVAQDNLGIELMDKGSPKDAIPHFEIALQISPNYSLAHNNLGVALARMGRFDEAITHYRAAMTLHPEDAEVHFNLANALNPGFVGRLATGGPVQNNRPDVGEAREHYKVALTLDANFVNAHINWGNLELAEGNREAALAHYQDAIRIAPRDALAHFDSGNVLAQMGKTNDAIASFARAVEIQPGNPEGHFRLANLLADQGNLELAIAHYKSVVELTPSHFVAWNNLGSALARQGKLEEASRRFSEAIRLNPDYVEARVNLGKTLESQGRLEEATAQYLEALRLEPDVPEVHRSVALALEQQRKTEAAVFHFAEAARLKPEDSTAQYELAIAMVKNGRSDLAVESFRAALRLKPDWVQALNNLAWILATHANAEIRNGSQAIELAQRACELTGYKEPRVIGTLDAAYAEAGRFQEAITTAKKTRELALAAGKQDLAGTAQARLEMYQRGTPFRADPGRK